ncbi:hypothetical protein MA16_Dca019450 [Dendrobium catenatum]|uniref:Uncharacterized protein n=1 Tax=Dendrobium catenatum TaxID=906689 RepID=A0A2I0WHG3_9ASPA|nr:hypothetical protein MA16_Dca019450 [Dendrobium catenatum]
MTIEIIIIEVDPMGRPVAMGAWGDDVGCEEGRVDPPVGEGNLVLLEGRIGVEAVGAWLLANSSCLQNPLWRTPIDEGGSSINPDSVHNLGSNAKSKQLLPLNIPIDAVDICTAQENMECTNDFLLDGMDAP